LKSATKLRSGTPDPTAARSFVTDYKAAAAPAATPSADQPRSPRNRRPKRQKIIVGARERGKVIADRLAANAKLFDEVLLGEKVDLAADANAANSDQVCYLRYF